MNYLKDEKQARKIAKEQQFLRRKARRSGVERLSGEERAKIDRNITFDNIDDILFTDQEDREYEGSEEYR
jgi:hypothetical protein